MKYKYDGQWIELPTGGDSTVTKEDGTPNGYILVNGQPMQVYDDTELKKSLADGKSLIAATISKYGVATDKYDSFETIDANLRVLLGLEPITYTTGDSRLKIINATGYGNWDGNDMSLLYDIDPDNGAWRGEAYVTGVWLQFELETASIVSTLYLTYTVQGSAITYPTIITGGETVDNMRNILPNNKDQIVITPSKTNNRDTVIAHIDTGGLPIKFIKIHWPGPNNFHDTGRTLRINDIQLYK